MSSGLKILLDSTYLLSAEWACRWGLIKLRRLAISTARSTWRKRPSIYYIDAEGLRGGLARLGGEGRMAVVEIEEASAGVPEVVNGRALVLTPVLMPEGELSNCIKPLGVLEERGGGLELVPKVRVIQWGLGFSEVCKERRPMYPALAPGTVVEARGCKKNVGYLAELGYGALLPLGV